MKAYFKGDKDVLIFEPIPQSKRGRPKKDVTDTNVGKTNADHIRSMTDEELADFLVDLADDGDLLIRDWLKQPYREEMDKNG